MGKNHRVGSHGPGVPRVSGHVRFAFSEGAARKFDAFMIAQRATSKEAQRLIDAPVEPGSAVT